MKKYSRQISIETLKLLLARSGNQCAFPNCVHPIFDDNNLLIAQLCHIEGVSPLGQRHNPNKSDKETNSLENLLFLCYRHHKVTDNVDLYPVEKLIDIKANHEAKFREATYKYTDEALTALVKEANTYWNLIEELHSNHIVPELAVPIDSKSDILKLIAQIDNNLIALNKVNLVLMDKCKSSHFEYVCIALPNLLSRIRVAIDQIGIKYIEELLLKNPEALELKEKLMHLRKAFAETAQSAGLAD